MTRKLSIMYTSRKNKCSLVKTVCKSKNVNSEINFEDMNVDLKLDNSFWNQFVQVGCWKCVTFKNPFIQVMDFLHVIAKKINRFTEKCEIKVRQNTKFSQNLEILVSRNKRTSKSRN